MPGWLQNSVRWFSVLPAVSKCIVAVFGLSALVAVVVLAIFASPLLAGIAGLALVVSSFVLLIRLFRRRPLRRWAVAAVASFGALVVFTEGI